jgi:hypothetical protein
MSKSLDPNEHLQMHKKRRIKLRRMNICKCINEEDMYPVELRRMNICKCIIRGR